jgi:hypothetical protein
MKFVRLLDYTAIVFALAAAGAGLASSYEGAATAVMGLGTVLALRSIASGIPVRQWVHPRRQLEPRTGPITTLASGIQSAMRGSYVSQAQIGRILRSVESNTTKGVLPSEIMEPSRSDNRLKGSRYLSELEAAVRVLKND